VDYSVVKWDGTLKGYLSQGRHIAFRPTAIRRAIYRPFSKKYLYFDRLVNNSVYLQGRFFPTVAAEQENRAIVVTNEPQIEFSALMVNVTPCLHVGGRQGQCFPLFVYDEDGGNRRDNITDWALDLFQGRYESKEITKHDIFNYVYGVLHHTEYRQRFAGNLKRELPRIPLLNGFSSISAGGALLSELHTNFENVERWPLEWVEAPKRPLSLRVEKMTLSKDRATLRINDTLSLRGIPPEVHDYRIGGRSALAWVIDQHQLRHEGKEPLSDPNSVTSPGEVVDLVGRVVRVSVETVRIVREMSKHE
jgi:predicted helicase